MANVEHIQFDIEVALAQQLGAQPLPFPGMDKSGSAVCEFYVRSTCSLGQLLDGFQLNRDTNFDSFIVETNKNSLVNFQDNYCSNMNFSMHRRNDDYGNLGCCYFFMIVID